MQKPLPRRYIDVDRNADEDGDKDDDGDNGHPCHSEAGAIVSFTKASASERQRRRVCFEAEPRADTTSRTV